MPDLYSEQDAITKIIVPTLKRLGYDEDKNYHINLRFNHLIKVNQGREHKDIFADIVVFIDNAPVIVIDGKNPREYLTEQDKGQVISYARLIGSTAPYSALCNGHTWQVFDTITKNQIKGLPKYEDLLKDLQQRRLTSKQRENLARQAIHTLFAIESARELSRIMRRCHDIIRNLKGYDPTKAFDELSKLLFAKMYEEREISSGKRAEDENRFTTKRIVDMRKDGVEIIQTLWKDTLNSDQYKGVFSDEDTITTIELPPQAIDKVVSILEDKSLGLTDLDVKGIAFEEFLSATYRGGGLGQFFTPRDIVNFMVDLIEPAIGENVIDPTCGTGGFLIRVYDVISEKIQNSELADSEKKRKLEELAKSRLIGIDWEVRAARTCKMNMIIHGDGHAGVYHANALDIQEVNEKVEQRQLLYPDTPSIIDGAFDIVLTNPPFGATDTLKQILDLYELGKVKTSQKREVLVLERCIRLLRPGGRMAIVIPEGILSNKNDYRIRKYICDECIIKAIIRLPQDAFKMSGGAANTSILIATKKDVPTDSTEEKEFALREQGDIFFARAEYIGISPSGNPIPQNDLLIIKDEYKRFEEEKWDGLELKSVDNEHMEVIRNPNNEGEAPWIEPAVNRTSLLYDRLSYVVRSPIIKDRFSYTYFHPKYYQISKILDDMPNVVTLDSICIEGYPRRGKRPSMEAIEGIPILKVRNITGQGIGFDTEYAPDGDETLHECERALVRQYDLIITSTGEGTIGRVDIYMPEEKAIADGHNTICRLKPDINPRYVLEYLQSEFGQIQIQRHISGSTGQTELLIDHIKSLRIPLPSKEAQDMVVNQMDEARGRSGELLNQVQKFRSDSAKEIAEARQQMLDILKI
jgi:type I restriction enzyme M protein